MWRQVSARTMRNGTSRGCSETARSKHRSASSQRSCRRATRPASVLQFGIVRQTGTGKLHLDLCLVRIVIEERVEGELEMHSPGVRLQPSRFFQRGFGESPVVD